MEISIIIKELIIIIKAKIITIIIIEVKIIAIIIIIEVKIIK